MGGIDILLELVLVGLLSVTLLHAVRLQRCLTSLRQDRAAFDQAVSGFDGGTREAEATLLRLRAAADQVDGQLRTAVNLKEDLVYLSERGEHLADQLEALVRNGRAIGTAESQQTQTPATLNPSASNPPVRSQAERSLLLALQARR